MPVLSTLGGASAFGFGLNRLAAGIGAETDEYWANTVLLLNADDASNAGQNNTFLDSSSNAHTITLNGRVVQGSFSPFSMDDGKWGNEATTAGDYFTTPTSSTFSFDADFTVECWVYQMSRGNNGVVAEIESYTNGVMIRLGTDGGIYDRVYVNNTIVASISPFVALNTWAHIAVVRSGTTVTVYVDGVSRGSATVSGTVNSTSGETRLFAPLHTTATAQPFFGYISNFRIVKGTAVYTSAFTPSTGPLTAVSGTELLTCQSNGFVDNSSNAHSITLTGTPRVVPFSPFPQTTAYDASTNGGSGYFDGSDDYLSTASNDILSMGTNDFTVNMWVYPIGGTGVLLDNNWDAATNAWQIYLSSLEVQVYNGNGGGSNIVITGGTLKANSWSYLSVVKSGTTVTIYINGSSTGSGTANVTFGRTTNNYVGVQAAGAADYTGYISDLVVIKNSAVAPSGVPSSPPSSSGTELCLHFTNSSIVDATGKNVVETLNTAQVDTTIVKYGTGSVEFNDSTSTALRIPWSDALFDMGTGDLTIEMWAYPLPGAEIFLSWGENAANRIDVGFLSGELRFLIEENDNRDLNFSGVLLTSMQNKWAHYAFVRDGNTIRIFVDGTEEFSNTYTPALPTGNATGVNIGRRSYTANNNSDSFGGYLDDIRVTKGVARYTTSFTPPDGPLPTQ